MTVTPTWIRLPGRGGKCPHTGYSRSALANLTIPSQANQFRPPVIAKCDKKPGNLRGIWLINFESLMAYINALPTPGAEKAHDTSAPGVADAGQPTPTEAARRGTITPFPHGKKRARSRDGLTR